MTLLREQWGDLEIQAIISILVNTILTMFVLQETLSQIIVLEIGFESTQNRNIHILIDLAVYSSSSVSTHIQPHTKDIFHRLNYFPFFLKKSFCLFSSVFSAEKGFFSSFSFVEKFVKTVSRAWL